MISSHQRALAWIGIGVGCLLALAWLQAHAVNYPISIHDMHSLPLPAHVVFSASIVSARESGTAIVLELENNGRITCYWRKPPALRFFFPRERVQIEGVIESTPKGKLCVVNSLASAAD